MYDKTNATKLSSYLDFQQQNVENMRSPNVPMLPNASQINTMSTQQLLDLKSNVS